MTREEALAALEEASDVEQVLLMDPRDEYDQFMVGIAVRGAETVAVYDRDALIAHFANDADPGDEDTDPETSAIEHFDFNVNQGGEGKPFYVTLFDADR